MDSFILEEQLGGTISGMTENVHDRNFKRFLEAVNRTTIIYNKENMFSTRKQHSEL